MTEFSTRCVHAGLEPDPTYRSVIPPIHQTSTYVQDAPGEHVGEFGYSRSANPTRSALETALGELEGGLACAFSSGMAAEHALITAIASAGAHVVLPDDLYGGTYRLVDKVLSRFGLEYDMVDQRGVVTSGSLSPCLEIGIGLAYVPVEDAEPGTRIDVDVRGKTRPAEVREKPLVGHKRPARPGAQ